jgi:hypothetical protein
VRAVATSYKITIDEASGPQLRISSYQQHQLHVWSDLAVVIVPCQKKQLNCPREENCTCKQIFTQAILNGDRDRGITQNF